MSRERPTRIGIGLVARDGRYLIRERQRPPLIGLWEFPGGKCEPDESPQAATEREGREELGLDVIVAEAARSVEVHEYPHGVVELHFFDARLTDPQAEPGPDSGFRWVAAAELPKYPFPEANRAIVAELARQGLAIE